MILIFGGTTEGRLAVEVCEQSGKPFFYATKGNLQSVEMHHGVRLYGEMDSDTISMFCERHQIACIIDAGHPFAERLHHAIAQTGLPVIRLQRHFAQHVDGVAYCRDYDDAMRQMNACGVKKLLALTGVNTIARLKPYWTGHPTLFRILHRRSSVAEALQQGMAEEQLLFFPDDGHLPTQQEEQTLMQQADCDAMLTKESGTTGGYDAKVEAALHLGMKVFVVCHPQLPTTWTYVSGVHGLRRMIEKVVPSFFPLRTGLTTGACATAATKAALLSWLHDEEEEEVAFTLPDGELLTIPVTHEGRGAASVVKDISDDPDVTKGCRIRAVVAVHRRNEGQSQQIRFLQGEGVGRVTLPGLGLPVGSPAINPIPRQMMTDEIKSLTPDDVDVTISVEHGEEMAKRTFNERVGVVGGISILGTSGIVHPLSNDAFVRSIRRELDVAWAIGCREVAIVAGMKSERQLRSRRDIRCVHYGNFIGEALKAADAIGFRSVTVAIMIGKAVKLAEGHLDTHSHRAVMNKDFLCRVAQSLGIDASPIAGITMARELWQVMPPLFFDEITRRCLQQARRVYPNGELNIELICDNPS